jgi:trans-AT polyketide synthase/acyltransferase/oxidoreductase domain-containing protein
MTTFIFPGQGSQQKGMGEQLFKQYPQFIKKADLILGYSIEDLCIHDRLNQLNKTEYTQPAVFIVNVLYYIDYLRKNADFPDYILGHSLGEYNALFAANVFDFETALQLVKKRAKLMSQASEGGMLAVIGLSEDKIHDILSINKLNLLSIANINSYQQIVVSGDSTQIQQAVAIFKDAGSKLCVPLKVSGAFHSHYMEKASHLFLNFLEDFKFSTPTKKVISNVTGQVYTSEEIKKMLAVQIISPVQWLKSVEYVRNKGENKFIELGHGNTMLNMIERIKNNQ